MNNRTTWNDGELRKLYRIYRYVFIVHFCWSRASKKPKWQVSGGGCGWQAKRSWIYKADREKNPKNNNFPIRLDFLLKKSAFSFSGYQIEIFSWGILVLWSRMNVCLPLYNRFQNLHTLFAKWIEQQLMYLCWLTICI